MPLVRDLPFFKDRQLTDMSVFEVLSLMTYKEMPAEQFIIEYGTFGEEFYLILEGECEFLVPNKTTDHFNLVNFEMRCLKE